MYTVFTLIWINFVFQFVCVFSVKISMGCILWRRMWFKRNSSHLTVETPVKAWDTNSALVWYTDHEHFKLLHYHAHLFRYINYVVYFLLPLAVVWFPTLRSPLCLHFRGKRLQGWKFACNSYIYWHIDEHSLLVWKTLVNIHKCEILSFYNLL